MGIGGDGMIRAGSSSPKGSGMKGTARVGALALLFVTAAAVAAEADLPSIPDRPGAELFKDVPAPWRDYLIKAREAERIADPLERCLAYPDLPGNQWPKGHAAAHCRLHANRRYRPSEVELKLQDGEIDAFERMLDESLGRHFSEDAFDEGIDIAFELFKGSNQEIDRVSAAWLRQRPKSAYAHLVRAQYFDAAAGEARGGKFAPETPRENFRRMSELAAKAIPLYEEAIRLQPRLMPAYSGLLDVARLDSRSELERSTFERARQQDPGCAEVARHRMESLQPRWGGSYESMLAYASSLEPMLAKRPLLANYLGAPYADRADRLRAEDGSFNDAAELLEIAIRKGSLEEPLEDTARLEWKAKGEGAHHHQWKTLAYLMQATRFSQRDAWVHRTIASGFTHQAPELGLRHVRIAIEQEPGNGQSHYIAGGLYYNARQPDQAEQEYRKAVEDPAQRQASLRELVSMWMFNSGLAPIAGNLRAKPYLDRLIREFPDDGRARMYRLLSEQLVTGKLDRDLVSDFVIRVDLTDPDQVQLLQKLEEARKNPALWSSPVAAGR